MIINAGSCRRGQFVMKNERRPGGQDHHVMDHLPHHQHQQPQAAACVGTDQDEQV